ncbi:MAG TPA: retropepsin-like aspartic protease [Thermoanaerobaculia bacterium]
MTLVLMTVGSADMTAQENTVEVAFERHASPSVLLVRARVNEKAVLLILDTGASNTVLSQELLGEKLARSRFSTQSAGLHAQGRWTQATLELGGRTWRDRPVVAMNLAEVSRAYGRRIDGLIGQDLLSEFASVTIDFKARRLLLAP